MLERDEKRDEKLINEFMLEFAFLPPTPYSCARHELIGETINEQNALTTLETTISQLLYLCEEGLGSSVNLEELSVVLRNKNKLYIASSENAQILLCVPNNEKIIIEELDGAKKDKSLLAYLFEHECPDNDFYILQFHQKNYPNLLTDTEINNLLTDKNKNLHKLIKDQKVEGPVSCVYMQKTTEVATLFSTGNEIQSSKVPIILDNYFLPWLKINLRSYYLLKLSQNASTANQISIKEIMEIISPTNFIHDKTFLVLGHPAFENKINFFSELTKQAESLLATIDSIFAKKITAEQMELFFNVTASLAKEFFSLQIFNRWTLHYCSEHSYHLFLIQPIAILDFIQQFLKDTLTNLEETQLTVPQFQTNLIRDFKIHRENFELLYKIAEIIFSMENTPFSRKTRIDFNFEKFRFDNIQSLKHFFASYPNHSVSELIESLSENINKIKPEAFYSTKYKEDNNSKNITSNFLLFNRDAKESLWDNYKTAMDRIFELTKVTREIKVVFGNS